MKTKLNINAYDAGIDYNLCRHTDYLLIPQMK
jgi:hypothetical protein